MSLVITSSSQKEYDTTSVIEGGIQKPSSFQNFLNSPLTLDMDTEVAVVSVKCNRDRNTITIVANEGFYLYWGQAEPDNQEYPRTDINSALQILIPRGIYSPEELAVEIKASLDNVVLKAYGEVSAISVTAKYTDGQFEGYSLLFKQRGNGASLTKKPVAANWGAYISSSGQGTRESFEDPTRSLSSSSRNFVATNASANVDITGYNATYPGELCDCIGKAHPLSQVNAGALFTFNGSSASGGDPDGYTIGLIRSQGSTTNLGVQFDYVAAGGVHREVDVIDDINLPAGYGNGIGEVPFLWDVAFNWAPGTDGQVVQLSCVGEDSMEMGIITPLFTPSNASLQAGIWDAVVFEMEGEKMTVSLRVKSTQAQQKLVDGASTTFGSRVKPFGITCNQLYPKVAIHQNDDKNPGVVSFQTWNGHDSVKYYDQNFWGYGTEGKSPLEPDSRYLRVYTDIDLSHIYKSGGVGTPYVYKGEIATIGGPAGIANNWSVVFDEDWDGFSNDQQRFLQRTLDNMRLILGFDKDVVPEADAVGVGTAEVTFTSSGTPEEQQPKGSMFIRLKNMSINSYNANKSSISNIIYACPRFDTQGNVEGNMFYEPAERVYVGLNNAAKMILNTLEIDIVDVNERVVKDLVGNTLIVLHFRKRS